MSLVPTSSPSSSGGTVSAPPKTIAVETGSSSNMYTVPAGRKFVGHFNTSYSTSTSAMQIVSPTGTTVSYYFGNERNPAYPVTLYEGWTIRAWSYQSSILGVESDA